MNGLWIAAQIIYWVGFTIWFFAGVFWLLVSIGEHKESKDRHYWSENKTRDARKRVWFWARFVMWTPLWFIHGGVLTASYFRALAAEEAKDHDVVHSR